MTRKKKREKKTIRRVYIYTQVSVRLYAFGLPVSPLLRVYRARGISGTIVSRQDKGLRYGRGGLGRSDKADGREREREG